MINYIREKRILLLLILFTIAFSCYFFRESLKRQDRLNKITQQLEIKIKNQTQQIRENLNLIDNLQNDPITIMKAARNIGLGKKGERKFKNAKSVN